MYTKQSETEETSVAPIITTTEDIVVTSTVPTSTVTTSSESTKTQETEDTVVVTEQKVISELNKNYFFPLL